MKGVYWDSPKLYTKHYLTNVWTQKGYGTNIRDKMFNQIYYQFKEAFKLKDFYI